MPVATSLKELANLRWRIERGFLELKQELGLGHFEGRSWSGFHHRGMLCIAAYAFLVAERHAFLRWLAVPQARQSARLRLRTALNEARAS